MISAFFKALGDLGNPRIKSVLLQTTGLTIVTAIILWSAINWLLFNTEIVGNLPWVGGLVEQLIDVFGTIAAIYLVILLLPAFLGLYASFYIEAICRAVEQKHYPSLPEPRNQNILEATGIGLKFGIYLVLLNLAMLTLLILGPLYFFAAWAVNGFLIGREYIEMVAFRRMSVPEVREFRLVRRGPIYRTGLVLALIATIPIVNLLLPFFGTAMMLHEYERLRPK